MSIVHTIIGWLPKRLAAAIERESCTWIVRCTACGHSKSVWEAGGVRFGATGSPRIAIRCSACGGCVGKLERKP